MIQCSCWLTSKVIRREATGGALKQLAIGCASRGGKALIHSAGKTDDRFKTWEMHADNVAFPEAMADAAMSIVEHFNGNMAFINVMKNLSVDCDCCAVAEDPCMKDMGILASLDPVGRRSGMYRSRRRL